MKKLWNLMESKIKRRKQAFYVFLFVHTFSWTVPPFLVMLAGCVLLHAKTITAFSVSLTVCGITGVIGFFSGLLYLLSTQEKIYP